jgi:hypothetical protein
MKNVRPSVGVERGGVTGGVRGLRTMNRLGLLLLSAAVAAACAPKDDSTGTTPAGTGGAASGGKTGGGSGGTAAGPSGGASGATSGGTSGTATGGTGAGTGGAAATGGQAGGNPGAGGAVAGSGGAAGATGGAPGTGGAGAGGAAGGTVDAGGTGGVVGGGGDSKFSFFVVSMKALQTLSGKPEGFGGDLRFGKADGLAGADEICRKAAEMGVPGSGAKNWHAYLSATGVNARDRIGKGPWYDRKDRLLALNLTDLFAGDRPKGDPQLVVDFTNERGEPNHYVGANGFTASQTVDNHDTLTGSTAQGMLNGFTCNDWTSATATGRPMAGHSWPRSANSGRHWTADHAVPGCTPGLDRTLGGTGNGSCVGCSGGYGGFYCFVAQ